MALIRFEDVGPGGPYKNLKNLQKLQIIFQYLRSEDVPFHISVIPRYVNPKTGYDKNIGQLGDPYIVQFNNTISLAKSLGGTIGAHGYRHQYGRSISGDGYEFEQQSPCRNNCPPADDRIDCHNRKNLISSYAGRRIRKSFQTFKQSKIPIDWGFSTPHYEASVAQRCILETYNGLFFENYYKNFSKKSRTIIDVDMPFYRGAVYIPTPLNFVNSATPQADVDRITQEAQSYTEQDLAAFFYHPFLEFSFITLTDTGFIYDDNSYLKQLIRNFKNQGFVFVLLRDTVNFVPAARRTSFFPGKHYDFYVSNFKGLARDEFLINDTKKKEWILVSTGIENFPNRQASRKVTKNLVLRGWTKPSETKLIGDFNGDGKDDLTSYNPKNGNWEVALSTGKRLILEPRPNFPWIQNFGNGKRFIPLVGDFNGDGLDDILIFNRNSGTFTVALSTGKRFISQGVWLTNWAAGGSWIPLIGDFNKDGRDDLVVWNPLIGQFQVAFSSGSSFIPNSGPGNYVWLQNWAVGSQWKLFVGNFDGTGLDDLLAVDPIRGDWQVAVTDFPNKRFIPYGTSFQPWAANKNSTPFVGDFNGDGLTGIGVRNPFLRGGTIDAAYSLITRRGGG